MTHKTLKKLKKAILNNQTMVKYKQVFKFQINIIIFEINFILVLHNKFYGNT